MQFFTYGSQGEKQLGPETLAELGKFMEESIKTGILVAAGGLNRKETRVSLNGGKTSITDGPFLEGKELMPGFAIIQVDSKEQAIEWVTKLRSLYGDGEQKIVQIFGPA